MRPTRPMPHAAAHPMHPTTNHEPHAHVQEDEHDLTIERSESTVGPLSRGGWLHGTNALVLNNRPGPRHHQRDRQSKKPRQHSHTSRQKSMHRASCMRRYMDGHDTMSSK